MDGFGLRVRQARGWAELSQATLARLAGISTRWLQSIEAGTATPSLPHSTALYDALAARLPRLSALWLLMATEDPSTDSVSAAMRTRAAMIRLASAGAGLPRALPPPMLDTERFSTEDTLDGRLMEGLEAVAREYAALRSTLPGRELLPLVDTFLTHSVCARFDAPGSSGLRRRLLNAAADCAILLAWGSISLEHRADAREFLRFAGDVADENRDLAAKVLVLHLRSDLVSPIPTGGAAGDAAMARALLDEAFAVAGRDLASPLRLSLLLHSAEEHAHAQQVQAALTDLGRAEDTFASAMAARYDRPCASFDGATLAGYRGAVLRMVGRSGEAIEALQPAVAPTRVPRARAAALVELGAALAQQGDLDVAADMLNRAMEIAERGHHVERARRVMNARRLLPAGLAAARDLDERAAAIL